jgi:hypothetical protein
MQQSTGEQVEQEQGFFAKYVRMLCHALHPKTTSYAHVVDVHCARNAAL